MKTAKNLALLSALFVTAFAATQINALNIVDAAVRSAADTTANVGSAVVGGPYYGVGGPYIGRRTYRPMAATEEVYTQVEPGGVVEDEQMYTQPYGDINVEDPGY